MTFTIGGEPENRRPGNNTHQQRCPDILHLALEHRKAMQYGDHIVVVILPASHLARLQQAGVEFGYRKLGPAEIQ
jgi:hypothetical protein